MANAQHASTIGDVNPTALLSFFGPSPEPASTTGTLADVSISGPPPLERGPLPLSSAGIALAPPVPLEKPPSLSRSGPVLGGQTTSGLSLSFAERLPGTRETPIVIGKREVSIVEINHQYAKTAARWILSEEFYCHIVVRVMYFANDEQSDLTDQLFKFIDRLPSEYDRALTREGFDPFQGGDVASWDPEAYRLFLSRPEDVEPLRQAVFAYELLAKLFEIQSSMRPQAVLHHHHARLIRFFRTCTYWWCLLLKSVAMVSSRAQAFQNGKMANIQNELGWVMMGAENSELDVFDYSVTFVPWIARAIRIATQECAAQLVYEHHMGSAAVKEAVEDLQVIWRDPDTQMRGEAAIRLMKDGWPNSRRVLLPFLPRVYYNFMQERMFTQTPEGGQPALAYWIQADRNAAKWMQDAVVYTHALDTVKENKRLGLRSATRPYRSAVVTDKPTHKRNVVIVSAEAAEAEDSDADEDEEVDIEWSEQTLETLWTDMTNEPIIAYTMEQFFGHLRRYKEAFYDNVVRVSQEMLGMWLIGCCLYTHLYFERVRFEGVDAVVEEIQKFIDIAPDEIKTRKNDMFKLMLVAVTINTRTLDEAGEARVLDSDKARMAVETAKSMQADNEQVKRFIKTAMEANPRVRATAPAAVQKQAKKRARQKEQKKAAGKGEGKHEKGTVPDIEKLPAAGKPAAAAVPESAEVVAERATKEAAVQLKTASVTLNDEVKRKKEQAKPAVKQVKTAVPREAKRTRPEVVIDLSQSEENLADVEVKVPPPESLSDASARRKEERAKKEKRRVVPEITKDDEDDAIMAGAAKSTPRVIPKDARPLLSLPAAGAVSMTLSALGAPESSTLSIRPEVPPSQALLQPPSQAVVKPPSPTVMKPPAKQASTIPANATQLAQPKPSHPVPAKTPAKQPVPPTPKPPGLLQRIVETVSPEQRLKREKQEQEARLLSARRQTEAAELEETLPIVATSTPVRPATAPATASSLESPIMPPLNAREVILQLQGAGAPGVGIVASTTPISVPAPVAAATTASLSSVSSVAAAAPAPAKTGGRKRIFQSFLSPKKAKDE